MYTVQELNPGGICTIPVTVSEVALATYYLIYTKLTVGVQNSGYTAHLIMPVLCVGYLVGTLLVSSVWNTNSNMLVAWQSGCATPTSIQMCVGHGRLRW